MAGEAVRRFMDALGALERGGDVAAFARLFTDDAELTKVVWSSPGRGAAGAREFWDDYLGTFAGIRSRFTHVLEGPGGAALEWESEGRLKDGRPIKYRGVSLLEWAGDRVRRFRTYYDTAAFLPDGAKNADAKAAAADDPAATVVS